MGSSNKNIHLIEVNSMVATDSGIVVDAEEASQRMTLAEQNLCRRIFKDALDKSGELPEAVNCEWSSNPDRKPQVARMFQCDPEWDPVLGMILFLNNEGKLVANSMLDKSKLDERCIRLLEESSAMYKRRCKEEIEESGRVFEEKRRAQEEKRRAQAAKMREEERQLLEKRVNERNAGMLESKCRNGNAAYVAGNWTR